MASSSNFENYQKGLLGAEAFGHPASDAIVALTLHDRARRRIFDYVKAHLEKTDTHVEFVEEDVFLVWFCKVLQNWKALVSTTLPDGMYYEVTYDGEKQQTYIDAYKKFNNVCVPD